MSNDPRVTKQRRTPKRLPPCTAVVAIQVHPGVWKVAMRLAGGKRERIKVLSATRVEVEG